MGTSWLGEHSTGHSGTPEGDAPTASGSGELTSLFERARQALASRLQLDPEMARTLAPTYPGWSGVLLGRVAPAPGAPAANGHLAAQLAVDRARRVVVRVVDVRTGAVVRELPSGALDALASKIGRAVTNGQKR